MHTVGTAEVDALVERLLGLRHVSAPVVVGCSGGPDSLALLVLANAAALNPVAVHVDHGSRPGSDADATAVEAHAARLGVAFRVEQVDVQRGPNYEARARAARYEALERARDELDASAILVGHTADDQAETVLLNVLRGSASAGLGAMPVQRDRIVRPLLEIRRSETEGLCGVLGLEPVRDPSNDDVSLRRNWIRHEILPALSAGAARDLVPVLARQAAILRDESDYLDTLARAAWPADGARPARPLAEMPAVLARRAVRLWLGPPPPSLDEVERVLDVARGEARATEVAGGRRVWRTGGCLYAEDRR
ncbi:MAG: tRNA lysidine(34) synthetase TilS [Acidimicrobiia bacterium]